MCGIVGVFGQIGVPLENVFSDLLIFDQVRGFDSTGVCIVPKINPNPNVLKGVVNPAWLLGSKEYAEVTKTSLLSMLGHNRAATKGTVEQKNAHPFTHGHITGVHNGTATSVSSLLDHEKFTVDSDNIYYHLSQKGPEDLWKNFYGAAALVWWDNKQKSLQFLRNYQRPLCMAITENENAVIYASEAEMLRCAADRRKVKIGEIVEVTPNNLYTLTFTTKVEIETKDCPAYSYTYTGTRTSYSYGNEDYDRNWRWNRQGYYQSRKKETTEALEESTKELNKRTSYTEDKEGKGNERGYNSSSSVSVTDMQAYVRASKEIDAVEAINEEMSPFRWLRSRSRFVCTSAMDGLLRMVKGESRTLTHVKPF